VVESQHEAVTKQHQRQLNAINALLNISVRDIPLQDKLERALDALLMILPPPGSRRGCIFLADEASKAIVMVAQRRLPREVRTGCARVDLGACACGKAAASRQIVFSNGDECPRDPAHPGAPSPGHYAIPIVMRERLVGVANLHLEEERPDDACEREFLQAAANTLAGIIECDHSAEALHLQGTIVDQVHDAVLSTDTNGFVTSCNKAAQSLFGYSREELEGTHISRLFLAEDHAFLEEEIIAPVELHGSHDLVVRLRKASGEVFFAHTFLAMHHNSKGENAGIIACYMDVTDQKLAQERLNASEGRFRSLVEATSDWIWEVDENGIYTYVSPRVRDLLGYDADEITGRTRSEIMPAGEAERFSSRFESLAARREPFDGVECVTRHKQGHLVVLETSGVPIFDEHQAFKGFRGIDRDVTRRKEAEEKERVLLRKNRELTNQLFSVQERELKSIARELHDELGQSLTAIRTDATMVANYSRGRADRDSQISRYANSIIDLTDNILDVINTMQRRLRPPALDALGLTEALTSLVDAWGRRHPRIRCELRLAGDLASLGEPLNITLYRIVQECLTNVARHSCASRVDVSVLRDTHKSRQGLWEDSVRAVVEDNGKGVDIQRALVDAGNFGLFGIRERVEGLGGELGLESSPGSGLRVDALLPLGKPDPNKLSAGKVEGDY